jgi:DNA-binding sugar fermentation-stimulating protein
LLWNENETPKSEEAAQLLFHGIVKHYCTANNVEVSPEVNIGRGPVDFKISSGHKFRTLVEVKFLYFRKSEQ